MEIKALSVVGFDYTLKDEDGKVLDSSQGKQPLQYIQGTEAIIPGLESVMLGKKVGDKFSANIEPEQGYGMPKEEMIQHVDKAQFEITPEVGMQFQADTASGPTIITVTEVTEDKVVVDANHPLAGKILNFDIEVVEVREATQEELTKGHVNATGDDCCNDSGCGC